MVPSGKAKPDGFEQDGVTPSDAVTEKLTVFVAAPLTVWSGTDGKFSVGAIVSWTTTLKLPFVVFPAPSVAWQETLVVP